MIETNYYCDMCGFKVDGLFQVGISIWGRVKDLESGEKVGAYVDLYRNSQCFEAAKCSVSHDELHICLGCLTRPPLNGRYFTPCPDHKQFGYGRGVVLPGQVLKRCCDVNANMQDCRTGREPEARGSMLTALFKRIRPQLR